MISPRLNVIISSKMPGSKVILLACGSFNPPTNMHLRMFEVARDHLHKMGSHTVIGGLISPTHDGYGKKELENSKHRIQMTRLALQNNPWVKLSEWECNQESWSKTRQVLNYHQNRINSFLHSNRSKCDNNSNEEECWIPENCKNTCDNVKLKLLCGADLLESFGTPGLWADEDIEAIVGQHGLVVITRAKCNPLEFIYNSDILTKYLANITIVNEWIQNEVSSTKIRRALRRQESVRYLIPDLVLDYIYQQNLYGSTSTKYITPSLSYSVKKPSSVLESPLDYSMTPPSMNLCNNNLNRLPLTFDKSNSTESHIDKTNLLKHPGQAVKVQTLQIPIPKSPMTQNEEQSEVRKNTAKTKAALKNSKSCTSFKSLDDSSSDLSTSKSNSSLKGYKSCDENLVKFIFTKHGIQVISDVETIV